MHAIIRAAGPEPVSGPFRDEAGINHPGNVLTLWSGEDLAAIDVYPVTDAAIPEGHVVTGSTLTWDGQTVTRVFTTAPAPPPTREQQQQARAAAYQQEADPIFFKAQRGEAAIEDWTAKIEEIRARYPYTEE